MFLPSSSKKTTLTTREYNNIIFYSKKKFTSTLLFVAFTMTILFRGQQQQQQRNWGAAVVAAATTTVQQQQHKWHHHNHHHLSSNGVAFASGLLKKRSNTKVLQQQLSAENEKSIITPPQRKHLVLVGGGHAHAQVIKAFHSATRTPKDLQVTLIDVQQAASYSGMVPGCVSGLYRPEDTLLQLQPLANWAGIRFIHDKVVDIDLEQNIITLADSHEQISFDAISMDIGSTSRGLFETKGALEYTIPTRPISKLVHRMEEATDELAKNPQPIDLVVIGGGAAGIELAMSVHGRWEGLHQDMRVTLLDAGQELFPGETTVNREALLNILKEKGIQVRHGCQVKEILKHHVCLETNERIPYSHCIWATGAGAHDLAFRLGKHGLAISNHGWIRVNENLQSISHPNVFAAGDCCTVEGLPGGKSPPPKAGVYAVRAGPILIENLSRFLQNIDNVDDKDNDIEISPEQISNNDNGNNHDKKKNLIAYHPQDDFLKLLVCGDGKALGFRFGIPLYGKWVFEMKNAIDQSFMDLFRAEKLPEIRDGAPMDTSQYDAVAGEKPPRLEPAQAGALLQRTDDGVDFQKAWNVLREMAADEEYRSEVLKYVITESEPALISVE